LRAAPPIPPAELVSRIGGTRENYLKIGLSQRRILESLLPENWSIEGKSVLDFGCGPGRALTAFLGEAERGEFFGCDIHTESIAWANSELSPPLNFFVCQEAPPLAQPDGRFDLVFGMSIFSHITDQWSNWLVELHRVMRPGAFAVISVLGPAVATANLGIAWDDRIGMATIDLDKSWEIGGPGVLLAEWWVREHWGRAFEILRFEPAVPGFGHDFIVMRKREIPVTAEQLEAVDPRDQREYASLACNLELVTRQSRELGERIREEQRRCAAAELETRRVRDGRRADRERVAPELDLLTQEVVRNQAEISRLEDALDVITTSNSWRITAPLRRAVMIVRDRR
jgi:SAM-dependent methyltransferase